MSTVFTRSVARGSTLSILATENSELNRSGRYHAGTTNYKARRITCICYSCTLFFRQPRELSRDFPYSLACANKLPPRMVSLPDPARKGSKKTTFWTALSPEVWGRGTALHSTRVIGVEQPTTIEDEPQPG